MDWSMMQWLYVGSSAFIALTCLFLITCRNYDDGFFGRAALMLLCITHATVVGDWWAGTQYTPLRQTVWGDAALALFFAWYLAKFYRKQYREMKQHGKTFRSFIGAKR